MNKQLTIQPNFNIADIFKMNFSTKDKLDYELYKSGRYALYFGLKKVLSNNPKLKNVYIPTFVCPQVLMPLYSLKLNIVFYQINEKLLIDKKFLEENINSECIIIVINYFGFTADWEFFDNLKSKTSCTLISDNCHSLFTKYKGKNLSKYGDLSFNSLRKNLPVLSGSQLFYNNKDYKNVVNTSARLPSPSELFYMLRSLKPSFIKSRLGDTKLVGHYRPDANNKYFFDPSSENKIDLISNNLFNNYLMEINNITSYRQNNYNAWHNYLPQSDFIFINSLELDKDITPYVFPCIAKTKEIMHKWVQWGRSRNISIINWSNKRTDLNEKLRLTLLFPIIPDKNVKNILEDVDQN